MINNMSISQNSKSSPMGKHILSKSTFIRGLQCPKSLYLNKHRPELRDEISAQQQKIFSTGTGVGKLAQQLFPGGIDASPETPFQYSESLSLTQKLISDGTPIIYESAFQFDQVLSAMDILVKTIEGWKAYEVKSSTDISDTYISDASLQYYVITNSGLELKDISIVYINNEYVRNGEIDVNSLFKIRSVFNEVVANQDYIKQSIDRFKKILQSPDMPEIDIGEHCTNPYDCDFTGHCWKHIPENSVFDISRLQKQKKFLFYKQGIISLDDVPDSLPLNDNQWLQVQCHKQQKSFIDVNEIREFLATLSYPLYFMDFETFQPAIPLYDNSRPYQQIPFQYSLHYKEKRMSDPTHSEFLAEVGIDPRKAFTETLLRDTAMPGDILVFNKAFEETRLREAAIDYPEFALDIQERLSRIKDLMYPFQKKYYYTPDMKGSYSIKKVLPALVPELSYNGLEISNGGMAMSAYEQLQQMTDKNEIEKMRKNLLEYCKMDTYAMVKILEVLEDVSSK